MGERLLDLQWQPIGLLGPHRDKQPDRLVAQAPQRKRQHPRRGPIQPLQVIDADHNWRVRGECTQHLQRGKRHRQLVDPCFLGFPAQQRDLQRATLRGRKPSQPSLWDALEQINQPGKRQGRLRLGGTGGKHHERTGPGGLQPRLPHGGLADPRRPLHHHRARAGPDRLQRGGQPFQLGLAAQHHRRHQGPILGPA